MDLHVRKAPFNITQLQNHILQINNGLFANKLFSYIFLYLFIYIFSFYALSNPSDVETKA